MFLGLEEKKRRLQTLKKQKRHEKNNIAAKGDLIGIKGFSI